jgi:hypothetical protein
MIGWIGENVIPTGFSSRTQIPSSVYFYKFQITTFPLSPAVANKQYRSDVAAHTNYS